METHRGYPTYTISPELPDWVRKGRTQFHNQHAGPAEVAKGVLTRWSSAGYTPAELAEAPGVFGGEIAPDTVWDWSTKYSDHFLDEMRALGKTLIQVNWSCGFSVAGEAVQREIVTEFTRKAHERDMRICAYLSLTNIFWKEAFAQEPHLESWLARYSNGDPHLYGNSQARYLACVNRPGWTEYLKGKMRMAIEDAGVGHVYFDNVFADCACELCEEGFADFTERLVGTRHALPPIELRSSRGEFSEPESEAQRQASLSEVELGRGYLHRRYMAHRLADALKELRDHAFSLKFPIAFSANNHLYPFINDVCNVLYSQDTRPPGPDWSNIPLLRYLHGDSDGWKPVVTNHQLQGADPRLSMAEAMAFQSYPYGIVRAPYNHFYRDHPELFTEVEPVAKIAVALEWPRRRPYYLQPLGRANLLYEVIVLDKWRKADLAKYDVILLPDLEAVSDGLLDALRTYESAGGTVVATGMSTSYDSFGRRSDAAFGRIETTVSLDSRIADETLARIRSASDPQPIEVDGPPPVAANLVRKEDGSAHIVHLLNYGDAPTGPVSVRVNVGSRFTTATAFSPDGPASTRELTPTGGVSFSLGELDVYSVVRLV